MGFLKLNHKYLKMSIIVIFVAFVAVGGVLLRSTTVSEDDVVDTLQYQAYAFTSIHGTYSSGKFDQHGTAPEPANLYDVHLGALRSLMTAEGYDKEAVDAPARKQILDESNLAFSTLPEGAEGDVFIEVSADSKSAVAQVEAVKSVYSKTTGEESETNVQYRISYVLIENTWLVSGVEVTDAAAI